MIVTTSLREIGADVVAAELFAKQLNATFVTRNHQSLQDLQKNHNATHIIVFEKKQPVIINEDGKFFFHRGLSELRILNLLRGGNDPLVKALDLAPGMKVLDCTLGLAADAIVAAHVVGKTGRVCGLESVPVISLMTRWGIEALRSDSIEVSPELRNAARQIEVVHADHVEYLRELTDCAFDVVYFDPMFRHSKKSSSGIQSLRDYANMRPLSLTSLEQALRVATSRVVVKELSGSSEFNRLGFRHFSGGRHSSLQYGILHKEE